MNSQKRFAYRPQQASYSKEASVNAVIRTALDGGAGRYRRDKIETTKLVNCQWTLKKSGYDYFCAFMRLLEADPGAAFLIDLIVEEAALIGCQAWVVPGTAKLSEHRGNGFICVAQLEVQPPYYDPEPDAILVYLVDILGPDWPLWLDRLDRVVNFRIPGGAAVAEVITPDMRAFFLNSPAAVARLECLEIFHPGFTRTYYVVRNATAGVTVKHEDGLYYDYEYYPMSIRRKASTGDLDNGIDVTFGDLGEIIPQEIEAVLKAGNRLIPPTVKLRVYRSDMKDAALEGPIEFEVKPISRNREGASFEAMGKAMNSTMTGDTYSLDRFEALRDFLY